MKTKRLILIILTLIAALSSFAQQALDTAAYAHTIITVQTKHYITSWSQIGQFDTSLVASTTSLGNAFISKRGTPAHHIVVINEGGAAHTNGLAMSDCAYIDILGVGSADPYGFIMDNTNNGIGIDIQGKCHDIQVRGCYMNGARAQGMAAKIEAVNFSADFLCDTSYATYIQRNIRITNCKISNNANESIYVNSTGWFARDQANGRSSGANNTGSFLGCALSPTNDFQHVAQPAAYTPVTVTNTGTFTMKAYLDTIWADKYKETDFSVIVTKNSGTLSGTLVLSGSTNGVTYNALQTQTLTNVASNTYTFVVPTRNVNYFKVDLNSTATVSASFLSFVKVYFWNPASDSIFVDSTVFLNCGRSGVNFSNMSHAYFRGNKGWHIGRELNTTQGRMLACGGKVGYLGDTVRITGNKCFGSFNNNFWFASEGYLDFSNNYGDSAGYWGTVKNTDLTPSNVFGVTTGRSVPVTWKICNNEFYLNTSQPSTQYALYPGVSPQMTANNVIGSNIGTYNNFTLVYSTNCGSVQNQPPTCDAGNNVVLTLPTNSVQLHGIANDADGTIVSTVWTKISGGTYTINNANLINPTLSALQVGVYVFRLTVTDNGGLTAVDNVQVTVNAAPNKPPNANAGSDITIRLPVNTCTFSNAAASDSDGTIVSTVWTKISGGTFTIDNANILHPTLTNLLQGTYVFKLVATDNSGAKAIDTIKVIVQIALNKKPFVDAGTNVVITLPINFYTFNAVANDSDGTITSYAWTLVSGGTYSITNAAILNPTVSALQAGITYTFKLTVKDNRNGTASDIVKIKVNNAINIPPVCDAGRDTTLQLPNNSYQTVAVASDADGTIVSYLWTQIAGTTATISNTAILNPVISNLNLGDNKFSLKVIDNNGASFTDTFTISIIAAANKPPICDAGLSVTLTQPTNSYQTNASASDSDGVITSYTWTQLSGGTYTISNASVLSPLISNLQTGVHVFQLTVVDNSGATTSDQLVITENNQPNQLPNANAGVDINIWLPVNSVQVTTATADDPDGVIVSTVWAKASGTGGTITNGTTLTPTFSGLVQGTYVYVLTATDDSSATDTDSMQVVVHHALNVPPNVNAGNDTTIQLPATTVDLHGIATDESAIASTLWTNSDGCSITSAASLNTTATCTTAGQHTFQLAATDDSSITSYDSKVATVLPAVNVPPVAIASPDTTIYLPNDSLILTQSGTDADGTITGYLSTIIFTYFSPSISGTTTQNPVLKGLSAGDTVKVLLRVTDNDGGFAFDTTTIIVLADTTNHPPVVVVRRDTINSLRLPDNQLSLSAGGSYDPDPNDFIAFYNWVQTSGDTTLTINGANSFALTLNGLLVGTYSFVITVGDSHGATSQSNITITVYPSVKFKITRSKIRG